MACVLHPIQYFIIVCAVCFAVVAFGFGLATLFSSQWVRFEVKAGDFARFSVRERHFEYYNRTQGLVWACVTPDSQVLLTKVREMHREDCFLLTFTWQNKTAAGLIHLRRSHIAIKSATHLLTVAGLLIGLILVMYQWIAKRKTRHKNLNRRWRSRIVLLWCLGALLQVASLAMYHAALGMEKSVQAPKLIHIYSSWEPKLRENTTITFAIMYGLEWVSIAFLCLAAFCMWLSNVCFRVQQTKDVLAPACIELPDKHTVNINAIRKPSLSPQDPEAHSWRGSLVSLNSSAESSKPAVKLREAYNNQHPQIRGKNYVLI